MSKSTGVAVVADPGKVDRDLAGYHPRRAVAVVHGVVSRAGRRVVMISPTPLGIP
jgi:hypothetical protein